MLIYPDGDAISGTIPFGTYDDYSNPARCFRYKVILETDDSLTTISVFNDFTNELFAMKNRLSKLRASQNVLQVELLVYFGLFAILIVVINSLLSLL